MPDSPGLRGARSGARPALPRTGPAPAFPVHPEAA